MAHLVPSSSFIDGDGTLVSYPDPFKNVTERDVTDAVEWENAIVSAKVEIEAGFLKLAYLLTDFDDRKLYLARGYETMKAWAESPDIELSWRVVQDLLRIKREAIPLLEAKLGNEQDVKRVMLSAGISKVRTALPLLVDENTKDDFVEVLSLAPEMPWNDVRQEVKERRGLARAPDERFPVLFKGQVTLYDSHATITVWAMDGVEQEALGKLRIKRAWLARFEERFGKLITFTNT